MGFYINTILAYLRNFKLGLSTFIKYRFYGIPNSLYFPNDFKSYSFNWMRVRSYGTLSKSDSPFAFWRLGLPSLPFYFWTNTTGSKSFYPHLLNRINMWLSYFGIFNLYIFKTSFGEGFVYLRGLFVILFVDALIADDEPIWDPVEWSLTQSWILFIFLFAWIGENLISSRYGSYTGRDKRVWFGWYKTFWLLDIWYVISMGMASLWVMVPHYYEVTYGVSFIYSWWNWYSRVFFFKFISLFSVVLFLSYFLQISIRWVHWKKSFYLIILINLFLGYLLYTQFFISFFAYFTDPRWHTKTRLVDYIQLSHEPSRWGWGDIKRDHFMHHRSKTVFWFKNDGPFASAFMFYNFLFFLTLFSVYLYWVALIRRVYVTQEITITYTTYCISCLKQFFYCFLLLFVFVFLSYGLIYWRTPNEFIWVINSNSWFRSFFEIFFSYPKFLFSILTF